MIRTATPGDAEALTCLRHALWPEASSEEHAQDLAAYFSGAAREPLTIIVAEDASRQLIGFCELSIRAYAEDCTTDRVGYLEGWFVAETHRRTGVGRRLVRAAEAWARDQGCTEFASDAAADNLTSITAHKALGFTETGLIQCFRKDLR